MIAVEADAVGVEAGAEDDTVGVQAGAEADTVGVQAGAEADAVGVQAGVGRRVVVLASSFLITATPPHYFNC